MSALNLTVSRVANPTFLNLISYSNTSPLIIILVALPCTFLSFKFLSSSAASMLAHNIPNVVLLMFCTVQSHRYFLTSVTNVLDINPNPDISESNGLPIGTFYIHFFPLILHLFQKFQHRTPFLQEEKFFFTICNFRTK